MGATAAAETAPSPSSPASRGSSGHDHGSPGSPAVRPSRLRLNSISEADGSAPNTPVAFARYRSSGSTLSSESGSLGALLVGGDGIPSKNSPRASPAVVRPTARASVLVLASTKIATARTSIAIRPTKIAKLELADCGLNQQAVSILARLISSDVTSLNMSDNMEC